jgi:hypothetical protein
MKPLRAQTSRSRIALTALAVAMAGCGLPGADDDEELSMAGVETVQRALVSTTSAEYKLPAAVDPDVLGDRATELWARVYRPSSLVSGKKYPLIVFLHGNHYTCGRGSNPRIDDSAQYTNSGTCPSGYVVTPNHRGYEYIANELAGNEYIVVSINANRGITAGGGVSGDWGLNLARGRLILKHLYKLSRWNRNQEATPSSLGFSFNGRLDFQNVGMMGHSRGGEGLRAAYNQYIDWGSTWPAKIPDPVRIRGLFEIGPVDGQTDRVLDALDARWAVLLPMCDGDVSDLQGVKPFDRMVGYEEVETNELMKASFTVFGANHNFYNTEWQQSDSTGCFRHTPLFSTTATGSSSQRDTGRIPIVNFFRGSVGSTSNTYRKLFNPLYALPSSLTGITRIDRGYISASDIERYTKLEHFDNEAPLGSWFLPHTTSGVSISHDFLPEHDDNTRGGVIQWSSASS